MPSIRQSQRIDKRRLEPAEQMPAAPPSAVPAPATMLTPSPFMSSSLPPIASGADAYVRQFYNRGSFPQQRILQPR